MSARYLIRFDDICPAMNWTVWDRIERTLLESGIQPLLAVVPDNRDLTLNWGSPEPTFWNRVKAWQGAGWSIALHGFQHVFSTAESGIIGKNPYSEFAGLGEAVQGEKLRAALAIFSKHDIQANAWIAPAHSFDRVTIRLLRENGVSVISDGNFLYPYRDEEDMLWVPQQISSLRFKAFGVWTVCYHANWWRDSDIQKFERDIKDFGKRITSLEEITGIYGQRRQTWSDRQYARLAKTRKEVMRYPRQWVGALR